MRRIRAFVIALVAIGSLGALASGAGAAAIYNYSISIHPGISSPVPGGNVSVSNLNTAVDTRIVVAPPTGPNRLDQTIAAGAGSFVSSQINGLAIGDTITVRQPAVSIAATETYTIPPASISLVPGSSVISGTMPAGFVGTVQGDHRCDRRVVGYTFGAGPFSVAYPTVLPGENAKMYAYGTSGDSLALEVLAPGETPCIDVWGGVRSSEPVGSPPDAAPYDITVDHLNDVIATSVRVVLRRGAAVLSDSSEDDNYLNTEFATRPLPGDVVDVYRPKTAPAPTYSMAIPPVASKFDPTIDTVAIDSPAAGRIIALPCRAYSCPFENTREQLDVPAGRNFLNFAQSQAQNRVVDLRPDDLINANYIDPEYRITYTFPSVVGDLVAPAQSFKFASKIKRKSLVKAFKKGYKLGLTSNEIGSAKLTLTLPPVSSKSKKKSKKKPKTVMLANATRPTTNGTTRIYLRFTKSGTAALRKLSKKTSRSAVLTSIVTDPSGNASTVVKKTKIKT